MHRFDFPYLGHDELLNFTKIVNDFKIKEALFSMGPLKVPGPDGLNALFY